MTAEYAQKLSEGLAYQDFVIERLYEAGLPIISYSSKKYQHEVGENKAGIEIKNDQKFRQSGNFYVETAEKSNAENQYFVVSGIYRNDNTWLYILGDYETIYVFSKDQLKILHRKGRFKLVETKTSQGFLLPVVTACQRGYVIKVIECKKNIL